MKQLVLLAEPAVTVKSKKAALPQKRNRGQELKDNFGPIVKEVLHISSVTIVIAGVGPILLMEYLRR